jgi:hypothetical protein
VFLLFAAQCRAGDTMLHITVYSTTAVMVQHVSCRSKSVDGPAATIIRVGPNSGATV